MFKHIFVKFQNKKKKKRNLISEKERGQTKRRTYKGTRESGYCQISQ